MNASWSQCRHTPVAAVGNHFSTSTFTSFENQSVSVATRVSFILGVILMGISFGGCRAYWPTETDALQKLEMEATPNPLALQIVDPDWAMEAVSDELDDYFRIQREERLRVIDGIMMEGWVETHKQIGATYLEPWRRDSTVGFERAHATLQTVRRWAQVRLTPNQNSYLVSVKVFKELEDKIDPEHSTVTSRAQRFDNTLDYDRDEIMMQPIQPGWIPMGRDYSLEQKILNNLAARFQEKCQGDSTPPGN